MGEFQPISLPGIETRGVFRERISLRDRWASWRAAREEAHEAAIRNLYVKKGVGETCSDPFIKLYKQTFHGPAEWARRHFEILQAMPDGYVFARITSSEPSNVLRQLQHDPSLIVGDWDKVPMHGPDGQLIDGLALVRRIPQVPKPSLG